MKSSLRTVNSVLPPNLRGRHRVAKMSKGGLAGPRPALATFGRGQTVALTMAGHATAAR